MIEAVVMTVVAMTVTVAVATKVARGPRAVVVGKGDATVIPWVAIGVEAPSRLDRDERRLGHVA